MIRSYPMGSITPLDSLTPSAWVRHREDGASRGMLLGHRVQGRDTVLWARAPFFETIKITSVKIKARSKKLKAGWRVTIDDAIADMNEQCVREMMSC